MKLSMKFDKKVVKRMAIEFLCFTLSVAGFCLFVVGMFTFTIAPCTSLVAIAVGTGMILLFLEDERYY